MSNMSALEQLMQLKAMTLRTGALHEAQVLQIRNYPLLMPDVANASTSIDPESHTVTYTLTPKKAKYKITKKTNQWCKEISKWVQTVSWDDVAIRFVLDGEVFYDSKTSN